MTRLDPRLPEDMTEPRPGGMIGLEGTPYAGYRIVHELTGAWTVEQLTEPSVDQLPAVWEVTDLYVPTLALALDAIDQRLAGQGAQVPDDAA